jgi:hypothetical protein
MPATPTELAEFHQLLGKSLEHGADFSTVQEALEAGWLIHPTDDDASEDLEAALAEINAGDAGVSIEEFDRQFRARHGLG